MKVPPTNSFALEGSIYKKDLVAQYDGPQFLLFPAMPNATLWKRASLRGRQSMIFRIAGFSGVFVARLEMPQCRV